MKKGMAGNVSILAPEKCSSTDLVPSSPVLLTCYLQSDRNSIFSRRWAKGIGSVMLLQSRSNPFPFKLRFPSIPLLFNIFPFFFLLLLLKSCVNTYVFETFNPTGDLFAETNFRLLEKNWKFSFPPFFFVPGAVFLFFSYLQFIIIFLPR